MIELGIRQSALLKVGAPHDHNVTADKFPSVIADFCHRLADETVLLALLWATAMAHGSYYDTYSQSFANDNLTQNSGTLNQSN